MAFPDHYHFNWRASDRRTRRLMASFLWDPNLLLGKDKIMAVLRELPPRPPTVVLVVGAAHCQEEELLERYAGRLRARLDLLEEVLAKVKNFVDWKVGRSSHADGHN